MSRVTVPLNCIFQGCGNPEYEAQIRICKDLCWQYNQLSPNDTAAQKALLQRILGKMGQNVTVTSPFWCDYGYHITVGDNFYSNHNLIITDGAEVCFGNDVFIAPNCCFTTAEHAIDPEQRRRGLELARPITVGNNVWIGAGSVILSGVTIGDNTVIGAGSVVRKDIPANVVAVGVPCKVLRPITEVDRTRYPIHESVKTAAL